MRLIYAISVLVLTGHSAHALVINCNLNNGLMTNGPSIAVTYDTESAVYWSGVRSKDTSPLMTSGADQKLVEGVMLVLGTDPRQLNLVAPDSSVLGTLEVLGHPLKPSVRLLSSDGAPHSCRLSYGDPGPLYELLVNNPQQQAMIKAWKGWVSSRPGPCDPSLDSIGYFQPSNKIALVMHGVGSNPRSMAPVISLFLDAGYSVIAPRLAHHFNADIKDLDNANYKEWFADSEAALGYARQFDPSPTAQVTVSGFSLGGYLATRLGHLYPDNIDRLVLFEPAWHVSAEVSAGSDIGAYLLANRSLNDLMNTPAKCKVDQGYIPSLAGRQVEDMEINTKYVNDDPVTRVIVPYLLVLSMDDEAIDPIAALQDCHQVLSTCQPAILHGLHHSDVVGQLDKAIVDDSNGKSASAVINAFLQLPIDTTQATN